MGRGDLCGIGVEIGKAGKEQHEQEKRDESSWGESTRERQGESLPLVEAEPESRREKSLTGTIFPDERG
jgi:hypothetical protein